MLWHALSFNMHIEELLGNDYQTVITALKDKPLWYAIPKLAPLWHAACTSNLVLFTYLLQQHVAPVVAHSV